MKIMFVVTSLMGAGHLARTLVIARAARDAGARPLVVSGGRAMTHLDASDLETADQLSGFRPKLEIPPSPKGRRQRQGQRQEQGPLPQGQVQGQAQAVLSASLLTEGQN